MNTSFQETLNQTTTKEAIEKAKTAISKSIPGVVKVHESSKTNDRLGADFWAEMRGGRFLAVDCKFREEDWAEKGQDDLALETWSVVEHEKPGWTRDPYKITDWILWIWLDSGRTHLIPFPMLLKAFSDNWERWRKEYKTRQQKTDGTYSSEVVFVPRNIVWRAIYEGSNVA